MHFGQNRLSNIKKYLGILVVFTVLWACREENPSGGISFLTPEIASTLYNNEALKIKLDFKNDKVDSVVYLMDSTIIETRKDTSSITVNTSSLKLGNRLLKAKIYRNGKEEEVTSNFILYPSIEPEKFTYQVIQSFPHDTSSYTQGLEFHDGIFYESDGGKSDLGGSSLRKVNPATGKVLQKLDLNGDIFAEGLTVVGNKILQLTWQNGFGFIYDKATFKQLGQFPYRSSVEGWGLAFDGKKIYKSDGTNKIWILNPENYSEESFIEVFDKNGPVDSLNELEFIDGKLYANIYTANKIVIIDPVTGAVTGEIDLTGIYPADRFKYGEVLNGIAYDAKTQRLFVTGKKWNKLFQIKLVKKVS
jgi:glutaminyl-peptide cyclotransferase